MMKKLSKQLTSALLLGMLFALASCRRTIEPPEGTANIYLTAAANALYNVPGIPANYTADKPSKTLHVPVYISRSGLQKADAYTVSVSNDDAAAQKLIDAGFTNSQKAVVAPAEVYTLPGSVTASGDGGNGFEVLFDANKLQSYLGKILVLSVKISNPSKFQLNERLSVLNIVLDVDPIMLGTKIEVTDTYIKNSGHPFIASQFDGARRGVLAEWTTSPSVKNYAGGTLGGYDYYGNTGFMSMERYSSPQIPNGKIYQSFQLPSGKYELTATMLDFSVKEEGYIMASTGTALPDVANKANALAYAPFTAPKIEFVLNAPTEVAIGVLANFIEDFQYFRLDKFRLYTYKSLWD